MVFASFAGPICFGGIGIDQSWLHPRVTALVAVNSTGITPMTKAYGTLPEAVQFSGMSRTSIYEALKRGDLKARKAGRRTLISFADLEAYLASLPTYQAGA